MKNNAWKQALKKQSVHFAMFFVAICALKVSFTQIRPVWDEAFSIFPAAITLVDRNFDYGSLLSDSSFFEAGPNVHATSLMTLATAIVGYFFGFNQNSWLILHLLQFAIGAVGLCAVRELFGKFLDDRLSGIFTAACCLFPLVLSQLGFMYLEIPLFTATALALLAYVNGSLIFAGIFAALGCLIKESGVTIAISLAAFHLISNHLRVRAWKESLTFALPSALIAYIQISLAHKSGTTVGLDIARVSECMSHTYTTFIAPIPDLLILIVLSPLFYTLFVRLRDLSSETTEKDSRIDLKTVTLLFTCIVVFHVFFIVLIPLISSCSYLPRYYVQILPALIGLAAAGLTAAFGKKVAAITGAVLICYFFVNREGRFYPAATIRSIALLERSEEYIDTHFSQLSGLTAMSHVPENVPIYIALPDQYYSQYPELGYVKKRLTNVRNVATRKYGRELNERRVPDCFYVYIDYPYLGNQLSDLAVKDFGANPDYQVDIAWIGEPLGLPNILYRIASKTAELSGTCPKYQAVQNHEKQQN